MSLLQRLQRITDLIDNNIEQLYPTKAQKEYINSQFKEGKGLCSEVMISGNNIAIKSITPAQADLLTLDLFSSVIVKPEFINNIVQRIDFDLGLIIIDTLDRYSYLPWITKHTINGAQLNAAFHKSWSTVKNIPEYEHYIQQIEHYIYTFLNKFGADYVTIPLEEVDVPELKQPLTFKVIRGITKADLITKILTLLGKPTPLKSETVKDLVDLLIYSNYEFTGEEVIRNNEAKCYFYEKAGILPYNSDDLFRYIVYKTSGSTLVINSKQVKELITSRAFSVSWLNFTERHLILLASSFNRHKEIWLTIKKANTYNKSLVNRISKLSKKHHKPYVEPVLKTITSKQIPIDVILEKVKVATTSQLISLLNVLQEYRVEAPRSYKIRNGKVWIPTVQKTTILPFNYFINLTNVIAKELANRISYKGKIYIPANINYALPKSEKDFVGNIPNGTTIVFNTKIETALVGIHWFNTDNSSVDLDLKGITLNGVVGWDSKFRNEDLLFSGDIINAPLPNGATEWLYTPTGTTPIATLVLLNKFSGPKDKPCNYSFVIASTNEGLERNYMVDPNKVIFTVPLTIKPEEPRGVSLGLLTRAPGSVELNFTFSNVSLNDERSNMRESLMVTYRKSLYNKTKTCVYLKDILILNSDIEVVDTLEENVLDLSFTNLTKTSLLDLFVD